MLVYLFSAVSAIPVAVPSYFILQWLDVVKWWSAIGVGVVTAVLFYALDLAGRSGGRLATFLMFGGLGAANGLVFWLVWRLGKPPRSIA